RGRGLGRERGRQRARHDHRDGAAYELLGLRRQPMVVALRPAVLDAEVAALDVTCLRQALAQRAQPRRIPIRRLAAEIAEYGPLLRARRERPRHRRAAAEQRDERAAIHSITSSASASSVPGTSRPSAFPVLRLITSWYLVGACTGRSAGFSPLR